MLAVIMTGGKQYKVIPDQTLEIDRLKAEEGSEVTFDQVLLVQDEQVVLAGEAVAQATVVAKVLAHTRGRKINVVKFKRRKRYLRNIGHRQQYTKIQIISILGASSKAPAKKAKADSMKVEPKKAPAKKAPAKKAEPKKAEPKKASAKKAEPKKTESKKPSSKKASSVTKAKSEE